MGRMYTIVDKARATTVARDLVEILAASAKNLRVHGWAFSQTSEVGDAQEEFVQVTANRGVGSVTSGSGGASATPQPLDDADAACGATVEVGNTTVMATGSGSLEELEAHSVNVRAPYLMIYTPEMRPRIAAGNRWTLELETTPADSITYNLTVWIEEE